MQFCYNYWEKLGAKTYFLRASDVFPYTSVNSFLLFSKYAPTNRMMHKKRSAPERLACIKIL